MRIIRNKEMNTLTLCPIEPHEQEIVAFIATTVKVGDKLVYDGRRTEDDGSCTIHLHIGGYAKRVSETEGSFTMSSRKMVGGRRFTLQGSSEDDKKSVGSIRDMCYFGSGGLIYLGSVEVDGTLAIVFTGCYCERCGAAMIGMLLCEWKVCNVCAAKCNHVYVNGAVHGGDAGDIGMGQFCDICGRGKPMAEGEKKKSQLEQHLALQDELGITVVYKDIGLFADEVALLQARAVRSEAN